MYKVILCLYEKNNSIKCLAKQNARMVILYFDAFDGVLV